MEGVEKLIHGLDRYTRCPVYPRLFGAKVYKIARDDRGNRLSYMKITGGTLKVKELLITSKGNVAAGEEVWEEKADQIRIYSGARFELVKEVPARNRVRSDRSFPYFSRTGTWRDGEFNMPVLEPVLNYQIILSEGCDVHQMLKKLRELEEEDPQLHIAGHDGHLLPQASMAAPAATSSLCHVRGGAGQGLRHHCRYRFRSYLPVLRPHF